MLITGMKEHERCTGIDGTMGGNGEGKQVVEGAQQWCGIRGLI